MREREVMGVLAAGMTADHVLERADRWHGGDYSRRPLDVVLAVASAHAGRRVSAIVMHRPQWRVPAASGDRRPGFRPRDVVVIATALGT